MLIPRPILLLLLGLAVSSGCTRAAPGPRIEGGVTNVLFVVIDTLRADHLSCYGYGIETSPNLDALSANGVRFANVFSTSSWTRPGMATLFTGLYPRTVGVYEERFDRLPEDAVTLAERLSDAGYRTLAVNSNPNLNAVFGFAQGFDAHLDAGVVWKWMEAEGDLVSFGDGEHPLQAAEEVTDLALATLEHHLEPDVPFYLQVIYIDPHLPYEPPRRDRNAMRRAGSGHADYDGEVHYIDRELQRLLDALAERGLLEDTLVIVTSDHGEGLDSHPGVPDSAIHGTTLYDSVTHVPWILSHPALPRGLALEELTSTLHITPTVMGLLGWPIEGELPGISLAPLITGSGPVELPDHVISETDWRRHRKVSVRTARQRFVRNDDCLLYQEQAVHEGKRLTEEQITALGDVPPVELYGTGRPEDLPRNRAAAEPELAARLAAHLLSFDQQFVRQPPLNRSSLDVLTLGDGTLVREAPRDEDPEIDAGTLERLRALGYLGGSDE